MVKTTQGTRDLANGYYKMSDGDYADLIEAVKLLQGQVGYYETEDGEQVLTSFGRHSEALQRIERAKLRLLERLARDTLTANPQAKVILFVNYRHSVSYLRGALREYSPLILDGDTQDRTEITTLFREPSADHRLLIANTQVGAYGVNLDDKHGGWPRYIFIVPSFRLIDIYQATERGTRANTIGNTTIRLVYGRRASDPLDSPKASTRSLPVKRESPNQHLEQKIFSAIVRKSKVTKSTLTHNRILPGEYPIYLEP